MDIAFIKQKSRFLCLLFMPLIMACSESLPSQAATESADTRGAEKLIVYKSPTCGCCAEWMSHMESAGFETVFQHPAVMTEIKNRFNIKANLKSCHTAVSSQGYVFEGHVPARYIREFLAVTPPNTIGFAVPGMPLGSPGMETGDRFTPYQVLALKKDGSSTVFAAVESVAQQ